MSKQLKPDTKALDAYFASWEPFDVRPQTPSRLPTASSRVSSSIRSTRGLYLEQLEAREVPSATVFGDASNNWDSALVWTPPSGSPEVVDVRLAPHSSGVVADHANVIFGEGMLVNVSTGTGAGTVLKSDALTPLDDAYNYLHGTAANPIGTDHMTFNFVSRLTGATAIRLKQLDLGHIAHGNVLIDGPAGRTTVAIPSNGVIPWNPAVGIDAISVINVHDQGELNPLGLSGIDVQMYLPDTPADVSALTTQVAALTTQVADAQAALTVAQGTTPAAPALNSLPWPEGVNASAKILGKLNVHPGQNLYAAHFSPDGTMFVTAAQDKVAKIWNAETGALVRTLTGNNSLVIDAVWAKDGQSIWTSGYDKHVRQYSVTNGSLLWDSGELPSLALSAAMSADGATLLVDLHGASPVTINTSTKQINNLGDGFDWADQVAAVNDGTMLIGDGNGPTIINPVTRAVAVRLNGLGNAASAVAASPDGQWIFAGGDSGALAVWNRTTSQKIALPGQPGAVTSIAVSPDGNHLFVGAGSQITAYDLRPLANNQAPTLLNTYTGIGSGPRSLNVIGKNVTFISGDGNASRMWDLDRSGLSGYTVPNPAVDEAQARLTALQNSLASSTAQLQLSQSQETGRDAIMEIIARQLAEPQSVEADTLEVAAQDNRVEALMDLQTVGGSVRISSWQGVRTSLPSLDRDDDGSLLFTGSAATLDLAQATHLVTSVSFVVTTSTGHDATVRFLRGDEVIATQVVHSGDTVSQSDAAGITGVVVVNEEQTLSQQAQDFLTYFNSNDGQFQAGRYAWSWWTQNGYKSFPQFGGASLAYFANHSSVPDAQKWDILREAASGRHYATLQLGDINVQGNMSQAQATVPHALEQTPTGLLLNAPDWRQNDDTLRRGASPGYLAVGRFSNNAVGIVRDPTKYSVINLTTVSGLAHPSNVSFHTPGGDAQLDPRYYQILGNSVVLLPGAPSQVVIYLNSGDIYQSPGNVDIGHIQSETLEDILPPEAMNVWTSILAIRNTGPAEGVTNAVMEITDTGRAITPGSGNALVNVWNSGRTGGTVRIITNEGTPQAHEISFSLAAQAGKSVSINFTTPANGVLSITTILPDGRRVVDGKTLRLQGDTSEKRVATRNPDGTWTLEWKASTYNGPSVVDGGVMDNNFVLWKQQRIANGDLTVADPANYAKAVMTFAEEMLAVKVAAETQAYPDQKLGIGGSDENNAPGVQTLLSKAGLSNIPEEARIAATAVAGRLKRTIYDQSLSWLPADQIQNNTFMFNGQAVMRVDTSAGKIIAGGIRALWTAGDLSSKWNMAFQLQILTDIPANRFMTLAQGNVGALATLLVQAQYGHLLESGSLPNGIVAAALNLPNGQPYTDPTQPVRIRFDLPLSLSGIRSISVFDGTTLLDQSSAGTYISIPAGKFTRSGTYHLILRITVDGQAAPIIKDMGNISIQFPEAPEVPGQILSLSTNPDTAQGRLENAVLTMLKNRFYVDNASSWTWLIASRLHHDDAYNAVDLSMGGDLDNGAPVYAPMEGKVVYNDKDDDGNSTLVLEHMLRVDGKDIYWYTKYLHMYCDANGQVGIRDANGVVTPLAMNSTVSGQIGNVGNVGTAPANNPNGNIHIHEESFITIGGKQLASGAYFSTNTIDQRKLLTNKITDAVPGLQVNARASSVISGGYNGSDIAVQWQNGVGWVSDTFKMIYDRAQLAPGITGDDSYWLAWQDGVALDQMQKLKWDSDNNAWCKWDVANNIWVIEDGHRMQWAPVNGLYQFLSL